eukprot:4111291-Pleurochrysis_carterae.AAC.1
MCVVSGACFAALTETASQPDLFHACIDRSQSGAGMRGLTPKHLRCLSLCFYASCCKPVLAVQIRNSNKPGCDAIFGWAVNQEQRELGFWQYFLDVVLFDFSGPGSSTTNLRTILGPSVQCTCSLLEFLDY